MTQYTLQQKFFLLLLILVTLGFGWILLPYFGAVFWGVVLAILFAPLYRHLLRATKYKPTVAALIALLSIIVMVILPLSLIGASLVKQALPCMRWSARARSISAPISCASCTRCRIGWSICWNASS
jgi:predicted PurR-regulated permease PerM